MSILKSRILHQWGIGFPPAGLQTRDVEQHLAQPCRIGSQNTTRWETLLHTNFDIWGGFYVKLS
jgi:hypothetical protein